MEQAGLIKGMQLLTLAHVTVRSCTMENSYASGSLRYSTLTCYSDKSSIPFKHGATVAAKDDASPGMPTCHSSAAKTSIQRHIKRDNVLSTTIAILSC